MNAAMTTIARHCMMTWLTPSSSSFRALGSCTRNRSWKLVQPLIFPASTISGETF